MKDIRKQQPTLAIALLAAGQASRFGSPKQLAHYQGKTLIERSIALLDSTHCEVLVITGAHHNDIYEHLSNISKEQHVIFNQRWQQGMSSSIKQAVTHCPQYCEGIMFIAVDQIHLTQGDIQSLIDIWQHNTSYIVCAEYAEHQGIPAIFPREDFLKLLDLTDDKGARVLIESSTNVKNVLIPNAELDIDTVEQLNIQNCLAKSC